VHRRTAVVAHVSRGGTGSFDGSLQRPIRLTVSGLKVQSVQEDSGMVVTPVAATADASDSEVTAPEQLRVRTATVSICASQDSCTSSCRRRASSCCRRCKSHELPIQHAHGTAPLLLRVRHKILLRAPIASERLQVNARCLDDVRMRISPLYLLTAGLGGAVP